MRLVILTSGLHGTAPLCVAELARDPANTIACIVCARGAAPPTWKSRRRKLRKLIKVGALGILNGRRIGPWFNARVNAQLAAEPLDQLAARLGIPLHYTPHVNSDETIRLFAAADADLGIALGGNAYIRESVFSVPRHGMINVHAELLPEFPGAQSVIWQIHAGCTETGFTVHRIDRGIDTGAILHRERLPIEFRDTLAATVTHNCVRIAQASSRVLPEVVRRFPQLAAQASAPHAPRSYTTPTILQYLTMLKRHKTLSLAASVSSAR
jgi:methionyl-tRNA formyltransferase